MDKLKRNIPNIITISRIISLILGFIFFVNDEIILSIIFYVYGGISDAFDGYFARKLSAYTKFGQYLDAISDKLYFLSLIIILLIYGNYLVILPLIMEIIISIVNYLILRKNKKVFTERVGKFKTTLLMIDLIIGVIAIEINYFIYPYIIFLMLTLYFHFQTISAYINQLNNKSSGKVVIFKEKKIKERIIFLVKEFIYYITNPVTIIK